MRRAGSFRLEISLYGEREVLEPLTADETARQVLSVFMKANCLAVACRQGTVLQGELLVWLNGERAFLRLDEHSEHEANDPDMRYDLWQREVEFADFTAGPSFTRPWHRTVTREQAQEALLYWLETGERDRRLQWT